MVGRLEPDENNEVRVQQQQQEEEVEEEAEQEEEVVVGNLCTPAVSGGGVDLIYRYLVEPRHAADHSKRKSKNLTKNLIIFLLANIHKIHNSDHLESLIAETLMYQHRMKSA